MNMRRHDRQTINVPQSSCCQVHLLLPWIPHNESTTTLKDIGFPALTRRSSGTARYGANNMH